MKKYRKGFTLVELLIVIIIIGILAGMIMMVSGAAIGKAEAQKIVANMRNLKTAVIMYEMDHGKLPDGAVINAGSNKSLDQYMDSRLSDAYDVIATSTDAGGRLRLCFAGYNADPPVTTDSDAGKALKKIAEENGWPVGVGNAKGIYFYNYIK